MKKGRYYCFVALVLALSLIFSVFAHAEGISYSWYIRRNGNRQPLFSADAERVSEYGGYYLDKNHGDSEKEKILYLTYDAGYENGNIEKILDVMKEKDVKSAFFVLDNLIIKNTDLVKRMKDEGHLVCNHTKSHRDLTKCTEEEIKADLIALEKVCLEYTGFTLDKYFRFPEGKYSLEAMKCVSDMGYKTVFWSFAYADWDNGKQPSEAWAMKKILDNTHNGAVILLHPTSATNAAILSQLIDSWRAMGYSFGTLDGLTAQA